MNHAITMLRDGGALSVVMNHIRQLEQRVRHDITLMQVPAIRHMAIALAATATSGIRHLFDDIENDDAHELIVRDATSEHHAANHNEHRNSNHWGSSS